jgi:hypothetical protein
MRIARPTQAAVFVVSALALGGCSSSQPGSSTGRVASLTMIAKADGNLYNCYEVWTDGNGDNIPDTNTGYVTCDESGQAANRSVPWAYSLSITVIPEGSTTEHVVTSVDGIPGSSIQTGDGIDDFISVTEYDPTSSSIPSKPSADGQFFLNGFLVSPGNPMYQRALLSITPGDPRYDFPVGVPNILGYPTQFDFNVTRGDTIIVRARKRSLAESPGFIVAPIPDLKISATLLIGGAPVHQNGDAVSTGDDKAGFTFSYAVQ